jgi:hypothetical protein
MMSREEIDEIIGTSIYTDMRVSATLTLVERRFGLSCGQPLTDEAKRMIREDLYDFGYDKYTIDRFLQDHSLHHE